MSRLIIKTNDHELLKFNFHLNLFYFLIFSLSKLLFKCLQNFVTCKKNSIFHMLSKIEDFSNAS
jgi:hypothetical protein